jgi:hypothetical protein
MEVRYTYLHVNNFNIFISSEWAICCVASISGGFMKKIIIYSVLIFLFVLNSTPLFAEKSQLKGRYGKIPVLPQTGKSIDDFVPQGWKLIAKATGDLNNDGLLDIVGVIENNEKDETGEAHRVLFISFKDFQNMTKMYKKAGIREDSYQLSIQTSKAIYLQNDGGGWGDPFILQDDYMRYSDYERGIKDTRSRRFDETPGIFVDRGSLLIKHYGGSSWRWIYIYRFRYQNNGWYLIEYSSDSYHLSSDWNSKSSGEGDWEDINYLTGKKISRVTDHLGIREKEKITNLGKRKLLNLRDFNISEQ